MLSYLTDSLTLVSDNSFIFGLLLCVLLFCISRRYGVYFMNVNNEYEPEETGETTHCSDKHCVRCHTYGITLENAQQRLLLVEDISLATQIKGALSGSTHIVPSNHLEQSPTLFFYKNLCPQWFWESYYIKDTVLIESSFSVIFNEFNNIYNQLDLPGWKKNSSPTGSWDVFPLVNQGCIVEENVSVCPETMSIIESLSSVMIKNVFGNVMFSVVKPSTVITEHYGPTNIRLRCHLGLMTTPLCTLSVADDQMTWEAGKCLVFDDSFLHSVTHLGDADTKADDIQFEIGTRDRSREHRHGSNIQAKAGSRDRAVLIVDLWHPDLSQEERDAIDSVFPPL